MRVSVTGLWRTDLKLIRVGHRDPVLPRVPGVEVVGEIVEKGARPPASRSGIWFTSIPGFDGRGDQGMDEISTLGATRRARVPAGRP